MPTACPTLLAGVALLAACVAAPARSQVIGDRVAHLRVTVPPTPVVVSGVPRLVYELRVSNVSADTVTLSRVQVLDADTRAELVSFDGEALARRLARSTTPRLSPGADVLVYVEVAPAGRVPRALVHRVSLDSRPPTDVLGGHVPVARRSPPVLAPPVRGGPWAAVYDASWERGHRRVYYTVGGRARIPGRFAIDFVRVDEDGRVARGDADRVRNWLGYGSDVLAVADAVVVAARDGMPESASVAANGSHAPEDGAGNYVVLDLGGERYAFYEHLRPGSIRVRPGQRVRCGDVVGALGYTGHSTGPHLHFHVADGQTPLGAEGEPFAFTRFEVLGAYATMDGFGQVPWTPLGAPGAARRTSEMPAPNTVVLFGGCQ
jgi:murein DD-endopeptidase MepM/ murein hydrolase activator NlpD